MRYLVVILVIVAFACNPVKKALREKQQIDAAIAEWILNNPMPLDTLYVPGDTLTIYDTTVHIFYESDTVTIKDTVRITKTKWREVTKEVRIVDTVKLKYVDDRLAKTLQKEKHTLEGQIMQMEKEGRRKVWWLSGLAAALGITAGFMLKKGFR
jgi:pyoverdine/dityrosine biosynthesis protein Dit1